MSYITTISGIHFDPIEPKEDDINIKDIAHSLSLICRANGHTKYFYSVAQHSIACAKEAKERNESKEVIIGCLLHDASEAYLSDVTRPVKKDLPYYLEVEDRLQNMIWKHFIQRELTRDEKKTIFEIDDLMLSLEFHILMPEDLNNQYINLQRKEDCLKNEPENVETEFIALLEEYAK